jgi:hypothetical protein
MRGPSGEVSMRYKVGNVALLLAVLAGLGLAALEPPNVDPPLAAVGTVWSPEVFGTRPFFADEDATGSINPSAISNALALTDEQRGLVFVGVINLPDVPDSDLDAPDPATPLASSVELQDLPAMVTRKIPQLANHKFVKLGDRILVVEPESRAVVSQIPRYRLVLQ